MKYMPLLFMLLFFSFSLHAGQSTSKNTASSTGKRHIIIPGKSVAALCILATMHNSSIAEKYMRVEGALSEEQLDEIFIYMDTIKNIDPAAEFRRYYREQHNCGDFVGRTGGAPTECEGEVNIKKFKKGLCSMLKHNPHCLPGQQPEYSTFILHIQVGDRQVHENKTNEKPWQKILKDENLDDYEVESDSYDTETDSDEL